MNISFIDEPELEFGNGGTHVDIRFGLMQHGPLDVGEKTAPNQLKVGVVGTQETIDSVKEWFERCRGEVDAKSNRQPNLFPRFPGFSDDSPFKASLVFHDRWCSAIRQREVDAIIADEHPDEAVKHSVELFLEHAGSVVEQGGPTVVICAPPKDLLAAVDARPPDPTDAVDEELDEGSEKPKGPKPLIRYFHDVLKAEGMKLAVPLQMIRPQTYTGKRAKNRWGESKPLQDEATRAWNIHVALYYKAGGIPWRLLRNPSDLSACFVGVSFYRSLAGDKLLTSVAQVFNELGEGIIVKGPEVKADRKRDEIPQLTADDAHALLKRAISVYRKEHKTNPARVVLHKTSPITPDEAEGFQKAVDEHQIDSVDLLSIRRSFSRLFRESTYPPLRGTFCELQKNSGIVYLRGSVKFFETYPGLYVPRPIEFSIERSDTSLRQLANEMMSLSKLNWNNTQFDGGEPITVRAARRVGDILKCVPEGAALQPSFRFFM